MKKWFGDQLIVSATTIDGDWKTNPERLFGPLIRKRKKLKGREHDNNTCYNSLSSLPPLSWNKAESQINKHLQILQVDFRLKSVGNLCLYAIYNFNVSYEYYIVYSNDYTSYYDITFKCHNLRYFQVCWTPELSHQNLYRWRYYIAIFFLILF